MSVRSIFMLLLMAAIAACGPAEASRAGTGAQKWPDQAQLKAQIQQCHLAKPPEGVPANEARAATLDYENQCYRQLAEMEHAKLTALQDAVSRDRAHKLRDPTLLEHQSLPTCQSSKPPDSMPENERRLARLDSENQCYRQLAETERGKLEALQEAARHGPRALTVKHRTPHRRVAGRQHFMTDFQATR